MIPIYGGTIKGWDRFRQGYAYSQLTSAFSFGNALHLDGVNDRVDFSTVSPFSGASKQTGALFVKFDGGTITSTQILYGSKNAGVTQGWEILTLSGQIVVKIMNGSNSYGYFSSSGLIIQEWNHLGWVFDGDLTGDSERLKIYFNGVQQSLTFVSTIPATIGASGTIARMGCSSASLGGFLDGHLDNVATWTDADVNHVLNHYNNNEGANPDATGLFRHYKLDSSNSETTVIDSTGNENGTLVNFNFNRSSGWDIARPSTFDEIPWKLFWLKPDVGLWQDVAGTVAAVSDTDPIQRWDDQSGRADHFLQSTGGLIPTLKLSQLNGYAGVLFDSTDLMAATSSFAGNSTVIMVVKTSVAAVNSAVVRNRTTGGNRGVVRDSTDKWFLSGSVGNSSTVSFVENIWNVYGFRGSNLGKSYIWINSTMNDVGSSFNNAGGEPTTIVGFGLGTLVELVIFDRTLTIEEVDIIISAMKSKYLI